MWRYIVAFLCTAGLLPFIALAAGTDLPAGFAPNSIWVSRTHITAGDTITIFTVVYNSSDVPLSGDVNFTIDGKSIGTRNFSMKAGETQVASVPWTSAAGTHSVFARIEKMSNADTSVEASVLNQTTDTITISVASAPPLAEQSQALSSIASALQNGIASSAPIVEGAAHNLYEITESLRQDAIAALQKQLDASSVKPAGEVLGASASQVPAHAATSTGAKIASLAGSLWNGLLGAILFIFRMQILFYALLIFVIFVLYRLLRTWMQEH